NAIMNAEKKPSTFICASAAGYYGDRANEILVEEKKHGNDFLAQVCKAWEDEAKQIEETRIRRVSVRTGVVLSKEEGALKEMLPPFEKYVGGPLGNGKQWFPWIHIEDLVNIFIYAIDNNYIFGAVNACSPNPVRMEEFAKTLGKVLHKPSLFKVPEFVLRLVVGEGAKSILASLRMIPQKLIQNKFNFRYTNLKPALEDLLR
ncbi:MAG: TIGR01777 family oxidoreductase, partial [Ignavibacteriaceae bacterium]